MISTRACGPGCPTAGTALAPTLTIRKSLRLICIVESVANVHGLSKPAGENVNENRKTLELARLDKLCLVSCTPLDCLNISVRVIDGLSKRHRRSPPCAERRSGHAHTR